jgi:hypothetical protein
MIQAFQTEADARIFFEQGYAESHRQGASSSSSAAIHWMLFQPTIIFSEHMEATKQLLVINDCGTISMVRLHSIAGTLLGFPVKPVLVDSLGGIRVDLIRNDMLQ